MTTESRDDAASVDRTKLEPLQNGLDVTSPSPPSPDTRSCCSPYCFRRPSILIYVTYFLSSWGDRMWFFASGIYLVTLNGGSLRLAAIFGFSCGSCILLFGGMIGDWVDKNPRLKVIRLSLALQNLSVALCAIFVCVCLFTEGQQTPYSRVTWEAVIVSMAIFAQLMSTVYKIAIEKDWIVEIASGDSSQLAQLNAITRSIDLGSNVLAPVVVGQIMTYGSMIWSAIAIALWNIFSICIEYPLLIRIYNLVPSLASKSCQKKEPKISKIYNGNIKEKIPNGFSDEAAQHETLVVSAEIPPCKETHSIEINQDKELPEKDHMSLKSSRNSRSGCGVGGCLCFLCLRMVKGWRVYVRQSVLLSGLALSTLYMTVMGFDSVTTGFIYSQGISPSIVSICCGLAGLFGVFGTFSFTVCRKHIGLPRTGIVAFSAEIICLVLAVASVWFPGSPFHLLNKNSENTLKLSSKTCVPFYPGDIAKNSSDFLSTNTSNIQVSDMTNSTSPLPCVGRDPQSQVSVISFMVSIVFSRIGLWMVDLVITQIYQENVAERERGVVNGVQNSINMLLEILKFILVILLPEAHTFGYLIIASFTFITTGGLLYIFYYNGACRSA